MPWNEYETNTDITQQRKTKNETNMTWEISHGILAQAVNSTLGLNRIDEWSEIKLTRQLTQRQRESKQRPGPILQVCYSFRKAFCLKRQPITPRQRAWLRSCVLVTITVSERFGSAGWLALCYVLCTDLERANVAVGCLLKHCVGPTTQNLACVYIHTFVHVHIYIYIYLNV